MKTLSIEIVWAQDLPADLKAIHDITEGDFFNYMIVKHDGKVIRMISDCMEPEDATFTRDLSWVAELIGEMYEQGISDGPN